MGALLALEQNNAQNHAQAARRNKVVLVGVDAIADALQAVRDGRMDATVFQDAQGQGSTAVEIAVKMIRKQPYDKQVYIPFQLVTKENVAQYLKPAP
jgi:inositol transport system substrate-binding protein